MVIYFTTADPEYVVYAGKDKYENELLIKYAFPEDVWFHVDNYSSAHVYVRLKEGQTIEDIPEKVINDVAQITKESSRDGRKKQTVKVIYTMATNLKKTGDMAVGEVSFHRPKEVKFLIVQKDKEILKRLSKNRKEVENVDLKALREERDRKEREKKRNQLKELKKAEQKMIEEKKREKELRSYESLFDKSKMRSNKFQEENEDDDDFI